MKDNGLVALVVLMMRTPPKIRREPAPASPEFEKPESRAMPQAVPATKARHWWQWHRRPSVARAG